MTESVGLQEIYLAPGDFYFGDANTRIRTILGSCISVIMWHPSRKIGGMCHYMLPSRQQVFDDIDIQPRGRIDSKYADEAFSLFLMEMMRRKSNPAEYTVQLFGGGDMFPGQAKKEGANDIAKRNIEAAHTLMARHGFKISKEDTGGTGHRNIVFEIGTGDIRIRHVKISNNPQESVSALTRRRDWRY
jgi:chemotaxis protein CheD